MAGQAGRPEENATSCSGKDTHWQKDKVWLNEEEKAVLIQCRRGSIARGVPMGIVSALGLQFFIRIGRAPSFVTRHSILFSIAAFGGGFITGVNSYKQTCIQKIMSLENSFLADQVREHMIKQGIQIPEKWMPKESTIPVIGRPDDILDNKGAKSDNDFLQTKKDPTDDGQPIAFAAPSTFPNTKSTDSSSTESKQRRTYAEIREDNRTKQLNSRFPQARDRLKPSRNEQNGKDSNAAREKSTTNVGRGRAVKRNKYGDEIYEDD